MGQRNHKKQAATAIWYPSIPGGAVNTRYRRRVVKRQAKDKQLEPKQNRMGNPKMSVYGRRIRRQERAQ